MTLLLLIAAIGLCLLSLTPRLPARPNLLVDLPSHFVVQYSAASVVLFILSLYFAAAAPLSLSIAAFVINFIELKDLLPAKVEKIPDGPQLKILQVNLLKSNKTPGPLREMVANKQPDIVTCCEVSPDFAAMLTELKSDYPHQLITAGTDSYRVAVLSKLPFAKIEQTAFGGARTEAIVFRVMVSGKPVDAASIHPFTPNANIRSRDAEFAAIAAHFMAEKPERLVIMGDFNATPWCPVMKKLVTALNLRNARTGRGINTSWPAILPFLFRIPIDHVLVSANLGVAAFGAQARVGSDHLPTLTTLYLK